MKDSSTNRQSAALPLTARVATIDRLRRHPTKDQLTCTALKTVIAIRLLAITNGSGRDPLLELTQRFASVTTAKAILAFADAVSAYWPENVMVMRPCCIHLSPDEATIAQLANAARAGDRAEFGGVLDGFVRRDRHDRLFSLATQLVSTMR